MLDAIIDLGPGWAELGLAAEAAVIAGNCWTRPTGRQSGALGPRTMEQLETQLAGTDVVLDHAVLDRVDEIVAPGITVNPVDNSFPDPALEPAALRRAG